MAYEHEGRGEGIRRARRAGLHRARRRRIEDTETKARHRLPRMRTDPHPDPCL